MAKKKQDQGKIASWIQFYQDSWDELKKVHTPTKQETMQGTIGVIVMVVFFGVFLGLGDLLVGKIMQAILT